MKDKDFVFVERIKIDEFHFLLDLREKEHEVVIFFKNGELDSIEEPLAEDEREMWQVRKAIIQMVENAEHRLSDESLPIVKPSSSDGAPDFKMLEKKELPKGTFPDTSSYKLDLDTVVEERRYWKDRKNRDLTLESRGQYRGVTGTALANAILGKSWKNADEVEPPLTRVQYNLALAHPKAD